MASTTKSTKTKSGVSQTIEAEYLVALALAPGSAPVRAYVGQVQAVDSHGLRITLMDWVMVQPMGNDLFVAWSTIQSALVATPDHDVGMFLKDALEWTRGIFDMEE